MDANLKGVYTPTYEELERSLKLAVNMLMIHEPGDSRAVSNEAVALCAVSCGIADAEVMKVIDEALGRP